jgi:GDP-mannose transporter
MQRLEDTSTPLAVTLAIIGYSLCSSTLLLANKMVIEYLPLPSVVSFIQIISSAVAILVYKFLGGNVDGLEWSKLKAYSFYIVAFVAAIYANMQALAHSNVETVIVFRACSPIAVTVVEYVLMDRAWPSFRSSMSLLVVAIGAIMYCTSDSEFALKGFSAYYWVVLYFFLITFEMTYGKKLTSSVKMESIWGPVLYCNLLAALPMFLLGYVNGDYENLGEKIAEMPGTGALILLFSCVAGTLIGYTGWLCRSMVSATTYTLVGVVNKFLTVLLNTFMWDKHSSPFGIFAVCVCLLAGTLYQQAPKRNEVRKPQTPSDVEDQQPLVRK